MPITWIKKRWLTALIIVVSLYGCNDNEIGKFVRLDQEITGISFAKYCESVSECRGATVRYPIDVSCETPPYESPVCSPGFSRSELAGQAKAWTTS